MRGLVADHSYFENVIWQIADLLRGPYRPPQYERVMLPLIVLRRFDCVLAPTKEAVLNEYKKLKAKGLSDDATERFLNRAAGQRFHNRSPLDFEKLLGDTAQLEQHLVSYIYGFSTNAKTIFEYFDFENEIEKLSEANLLFKVIEAFAALDLHPERVPNEVMGHIFENLIRRFNELANETAGDHFTPREVIRLMVNLLLIEDDELLSVPGTVRKLLDPACGTGGMLAEAQHYIREHHDKARLYVYGQDYNKRAFATAASDMLMKDVDQSGDTNNIRFGDIFTQDQFNESPHARFDYLLANPPFGVDWKRQEKDIKSEHETLGFAGRFGAGLPTVRDGSLLFVQHMISKFEPVRPSEQSQGSRMAVVLSGSPLFTGGAGSGESEIRKWIIENDWLEAIIALPNQMFYNTGIGTYVWLVTNRKEERRKGKVQLIDARDAWVPMRQSLGEKRRKLGEGKGGEPDQIAEIVRLYGAFEEGPTSKIFDNDDFGYRRVTVERPLRLDFQACPERIARLEDQTAWKNLLKSKKRDPTKKAADIAAGKELQAAVLRALATLDASKLYLDREAFRTELVAVFKKANVKVNAPLRGAIENALGERNEDAAICRNKKGEAEADTSLRDHENIPLKLDVDEYFESEVKPYVPDAWMDREADRIGYEINFNRYFYVYTPPRPLAEIDADLKRAEDEILRLLQEVTT